jgi:hypothetical protein
LGILDFLSNRSVFFRNFSPVALMWLMHSCFYTDFGQKTKRKERKSASSRKTSIDHTEKADTWESAIVLLVEDTE